MVEESKYVIWDEANYYYDWTENKNKYDDFMHNKVTPMNTPFCN